MYRQTNFVEFSVDDKFVYVDMNKVACIEEKDEYLDIFYDTANVISTTIDLDNLKTIQQLMTQEKI